MELRQASCCALAIARALVQRRRRQPVASGQERVSGMKLLSKAAGLSGYRATGAVERRGFFPNQYDCAAIALILAGLVLVVAGGRQMTAPMAALDIAPISLDPWNL